MSLSRERDLCLIIRPPLGLSLLLSLDLDLVLDLDLGRYLERGEECLLGERDLLLGESDLLLGESDLLLGAIDFLGLKKKKNFFMLFAFLLF